MAMSVASQLTCGNCGAPDLGTRFCESCGAQIARAQTLLTGIAPTQPEVRGVPLRLFLAGVIGSAPASILLTYFEYNIGGAAGTYLLNGLVVAFDLLSLAGVLFAGRVSAAKSGAKLASFLLVLVAPVLDLVVLVAIRTGTYNYATYTLTHPVFLLLPVITVLAWLLISALQARAYLSLLISGGVGLIVAFLDNQAGGVVATVLVSVAVVIAVLVAPRMVQGRAAQRAGASVYAAGSSATPTPSGRAGSSDVAFAVMGRPTSTNGFAVSALIFGLLGGTVLPIVFGHVALAQIGRTGERGRGMAIAGLILGYLSVAVVLVIVIVVLVAVANAPRYY
jgi:hypothetical protein